MKRKDGSYMAQVARSLTADDLPSSKNGRLRLVSQTTSKSPLFLRL